VEAAKKGHGGEGVLKGVSQSSLFAETNKKATDAQMDIEIISASVAIFFSL
jgi:hypothetical protein